MPNVTLGMVQEHYRTSPSMGAGKQAALRAVACKTAVILKAKNAPLTFRLPAPGETDPYFDRNRSAWNEVLLPTKANGFKPPVKSIVERKPGNVKGRRFIVFQSALDYFNRLAAETEQQVVDLQESNSTQAT